jgi:hypothetical protein
MGEGFRSGGPASAAAASTAADDGDGDSAMSAPELTEGEMRVLRHEEKMKRRREKAEQETWSGASFREQKQSQLSFDNTQRREQEQKERARGAATASAAAAASKARAKDKEDLAEFASSSEAGTLTPAQLRQRAQQQLNKHRLHGSSSSQGPHTGGDKSAQAQPQPKVAEVAKPLTSVKNISIPALGLTIRELAIRLSQRVQQGCLAVVHVPHNCNDGVTRR